MSRLTGIRSKQGTREHGILVFSDLTASDLYILFLAHFLVHQEKNLKKHLNLASSSLGNCRKQLSLA
ncbi:MAG: hypothetical protein ACFFD4_00210 [Candidatus Odinarchaeota archaeon]